MPRSEKLRSKIFLDGGDPKETAEVIRRLGFLDGQTTNPTLIAKNPAAQARLARGEKFSRDEILGFYRGIVGEISRLIPKGSVSIEVSADGTTSADEMFRQGKEMFSWIPNAHIKYPTTAEGLKAAERSVQEGMRVNMTLVFSQEQAAAVYAATRSTGSGQAHGAKKGQVFVSPFAGRLDDLGENGMDLIRNIIRMYKKGDDHVEVLTASVRSMDHFLCALALGSDIITAPAQILREWAASGIGQAAHHVPYAPPLAPIAYREIDLTKPWTSYDIRHELTEKGVARFAADWNMLIAKN